MTQGSNTLRKYINNAASSPAFCTFNAQSARYSQLFVYLYAEILNETHMNTQRMNTVIAEYFKTQPVVKAWLFGSYSRGEQRPWSDVDILVQYDRSHPIGLLKIAGMKVDLEDLLSCNVDLVEEGTLRPWAVESVNRDKKLIYERA